MPTIVANGVKTYYEVHGAGPPLVLVSGLGGNASYWLPQLDELSRHFKVLIYDQRGAGQSACPDMEYSIQLLADDLSALLNELRFEPSFFVGHSTGGAIGQFIAAQHPALLRGMILHASWPQSDAHFQWCFRARLALLESTDVTTYLLGSALFMYPPEYLRQHADRLQDKISVSALSFPSQRIIARRVKAIMAHDALQLLPEISTPTLVHCAKDDVLTPPYHSRLLASTIPNAEFILQPYGAHGYSEVYPEKFCSVITDFFKPLIGK